MKNLKALALAFATFLVFLSFTACSSSSDEPVAEECTYCFSSRIDTFGSVNSDGANDIKNWMEAKVEELNKTQSGRITITSDDMLKPIEENAREILYKVNREFNALPETHDFGTCMVDGRIFFEITKPSGLVSLATSIKYDRTDIIRFKNDVVIEENVSGTLKTVKEYELIKKFGMEDLGIDTENVKDIAFDITPGSIKVFNSNTRDIYTGEKFVKSVAYNEEEKLIEVTFDFKQEKASDYTGQWYILARAGINGGSFDQCQVKISLENK